MTAQTDTGEPIASITCEQAATLFCEGRDRELRGCELPQLHAHIQVCVACQAASAQFRAVFGQLKLLVSGAGG